MRQDDRRCGGTSRPAAPETGAVRTTAFQAAARRSDPDGEFNVTPRRQTDYVFSVGGAHAAGVPDAAARRVQFPQPSGRLSFPPLASLRFGRRAPGPSTPAAWGPRINGHAKRATAGRTTPNR